MASDRRPLVAELWLRGLRARVSVAGAGPLVVLVPGSGADAALGDGLGAVTVALPAGELPFDDALAALGWAADHARELGASEPRVVLAGAGDGAALAERLAARVRADGWPELASLVLIPPVDALREAIARP
jgi:hypothetical protein